MVLEVAIIDVTDAAGFRTAFLGAREGLVSTPGCRSVRMTQGIESPTRFVLMVEWDSVDAHQQNFRDTERFTAWRTAIGPYFAQPPKVEHFADLPTD